MTHNKLEKKTILIAMLPEWGAFMPITSIAHALSQRGYYVLFVLPNENSEHPAFNTQQIKDFRHYLEERKLPYEFLTVFPPKPKGLLAQRRFFSQCIASILEDTSRIIKEHDVSLVLIDALISFIAIVAVECEVPYIGIGTQLFSWMKDKKPPSYSSLIPDNSWLSKMRIRWEWLKLLVIYHMILTFHPEGFAFGGTYSFINKQVKKLHLSQSFSDNGPMLNFPHFYYLVPRAFDFNFDHRSNTKYLGCVVDQTRINDEDVQLGNLKGELPLIYCSLGTRSFEYQISKKFFQIAFEAFRECQDFEFVVNVGLAFDIKKMQATPDNIYVCQWVSQMTVLRRSFMMITNGGMNTIKECVSLEVPMIILPVLHDQPGNAARVVYHGLGVKGNINSITSQDLSRLINQITNNIDTFRGNLKIMKQKFESENNFEKAIDLIESHI